MQKLTLPAPAKLNLWLHIIGRRADGYHELETVFQFLDHGDELSFALRDDGVIRLHTEIEAVPHDSNLIVRAARMLQAQSGTTLGADIWLTAQLEGQAVRIEVADNGDGEGAGLTASPSTGVGLANIRDRLSQAYGAGHRFENKKNDKGGVQRYPRNSLRKRREDRMTIRTILVDDEPLATQGLQLRLQAHDDVEVVAQSAVETTSGAEQTQQAAHDVATMAAGLNALVVQFRF